MLCYAMLCYAMLCYAMLCYAMLCYAMLSYAMIFFQNIFYLKFINTIDVIYAVNACYMVHLSSLSNFKSFRE
jgi:hypothetical protein